MEHAWLFRNTNTSSIQTLLRDVQSASVAEWVGQLIKSKFRGSVTAQISQFLAGYSVLCLLFLLKDRVLVEMVITNAHRKKYKRRVYKDEMESHNKRRTCDVTLLDSLLGFPIQNVCLTRSVRIFLFFIMVVSHSSVIIFKLYSLFLINSFSHLCIYY